MFLSALFDFPDDALYDLHDERSLDATIAALADIGVRRIYWQYYGDRRHGGFWKNKVLSPLPTAMARNLPDFNGYLVKTATKYGLLTAGVMRELETGISGVFSPREAVRGLPGLPHLGGKVMLLTDFVLEHPDLRVKRRTFDLDDSQPVREIGTIKLYKQNAVPSRIRKEDLSFYVSDTNCDYQRLDCSFGMSSSVEKAVQDVWSGDWRYDDKVTTPAGSEIQVITLSGLHIADPFLALRVSCGECPERERLFTSAPFEMIRVFDPSGAEIQISVASGADIWNDANSCIWRQEKPADPLERGFGFDSGFGSLRHTLDEPGKPGYLAVTRGRNKYLPVTLCEGEPEVQRYWFSMLDDCLDAGFDLIGNRVECHSSHTDEPAAFGYNDCLCQAYFERFGACAQDEIDPARLAQIRGDIYTGLFCEGARRARARGRKVYVTLNLEMLHQPIPIARRLAYPANIEWQWERWLDEIKPDEINIRTFKYTPEFVFSDPQCLAMINRARQAGVPMSYERYVTPAFADEYEFLSGTGIFDSMILYEVFSVMRANSQDGLRILKPELLARLKKLTAT